MSVFYDCSVLSGRGFRDGLIPHPENSYRLWYVSVCDIETTRMRWLWPVLGCCAKERERERINLEV
jgi:hypothetical protein